MPVSPYPALGTAPAPAPGPGAGAVPAAAAATAPRPHPSIFAHGNHAIPTAATSTSTTASEYPHHPSFYQHDFLPQLPTVVSVAKEVNKATQLVVEGGARKVTCQISVCFFFLLTLWRSRLGLFFPAALCLFVVLTGLDLFSLVRAVCACFLINYPERGACLICSPFCALALSSLPSFSFLLSVVPLWGCRGVVVGVCPWWGFFFQAPLIPPSPPPPKKYSPIQQQQLRAQSPPPPLSSSSSRLVLHYTFDQQQQLQQQQQQQQLFDRAPIYPATQQQPQQPQPQPQQPRQQPRPYYLHADWKRRAVTGFFKSAYNSAVAVVTRATGGTMGNESSRQKRESALSSPKACVAPLYPVPD